MNELGLTPIESLDSDHVRIPGLDVDKDFADVVARGQKIARQRRLTMISSAFAGLLVVMLSIFGLIQVFNGSANNDGVRTASKKVATQVKGKTETRTTSEDAKTPTDNSDTSVQTSKPSAPAINPVYISILKYGNSSICTPPLPGPGEVSIGTSTSVELWNPSKNEATTISAGDPGHDIILTNVANNNATNGAYVELSSGFDRNNSYADVSTLDFLYCENGYKLDIKSAGTNRGYILTTERWQLSLSTGSRG